MATFTYDNGKAKQNTHTASIFFFFFFNQNMVYKHITDVLLILKQCHKIVYTNLALLMVHLPKGLPVANFYFTLSIKCKVSLRYKGQWMHHVCNYGQLILDNQSPFHDTIKNITWKDKQKLAQGLNLQSELYKKYYIMI